MEREAPSVPITTLAGVASLTDLLPEMPLPTPSPQTLGNKSLLFHPRVAEEAQNLLGVQDKTLVPQLVHSLVQTSADHIDVKDNYAGTENRLESQDGMPDLLKAMLLTNPSLFCGTSLAGQTTSRSVETNCSATAVICTASATCATQVPSTVISAIVNTTVTSNMTLTTLTTVARPIVAASVTSAALSHTTVLTSVAVTAPPTTTPTTLTLTTIETPFTTVSLPTTTVSSTILALTTTARVTSVLTTSRTSAIVTPSAVTVAPTLPAPLPTTLETSTTLALSTALAPAALIAPAKSVPLETPVTIATATPVAPAASLAQAASLVTATPVASASPTSLASAISPASFTSLAPVTSSVPTIPLAASTPLAPATSLAMTTPLTSFASLAPPTTLSKPITNQNNTNALIVSSNAGSVSVTDKPSLRSTRAQSRSNDISKTDTPTLPSEVVSNQPYILVPIQNETETEKQEPESIEKRNQVSTMKQSVVKLDRLSEADLMLMQKSLSKFAVSKPELAKELGIEASTAQDDDGSHLDARARKKRDKKKNGAEEDDYNPDTFAELASGNRKRKNPSKEEPEEVVPVVKPKLRRVERKFVPVLEKLSQEELMETNTFLRFNKSIEHVLKSVEEVDLAEIDDVVVQEEFLLSRILLQDLCTEAAKLKILGAMESIPIDKLVRLLNVLEINIRGGDKVSPVNEEGSDEPQFWLETALERVMGAADACLVCMYVMTSTNMPKRVYLEEVIDRVVLFIKYHLHNTIFPSYDSTYRLDNRKKDGRKKKASVAEKGIVHLYTKISELVNLLAELLNIQILTDTSVLHASSMGVSPFFAENVSELQLACLKLVTTIFTKYETHRRILLDDILASIARLPSTKRSLRTYRLNSEEHIQMLTALVLQLIQCVVALPETLSSTKHLMGKDLSHNASVNNVDTDVLICNKYEKAKSIAGTFLTVFLNKCSNKQEDIDYRPLFENFVQDLLSTVNKPEWPATELLLSILGNILVSKFTNKTTEMSLRLASLEYLGVVAARLRRDSVWSKCKLNTIDQMIKDIKHEEMKTRDDVPKKKKTSTDTEEERNQFLQQVLLDFLAVKGQNDEAYKYARHFYIAQWYKDVEMEKIALASGGKDKKNNVRENHRSKKRNESSDEDDEGNVKEMTDRENADKFKHLDVQKKFLIMKIKPFQESISSGTRIQIFQTFIDYNSAELIAQFLTSKRSFCQSFDRFLKTILMVLKETSIQVRTRAMKCLTMIVEADPAVLGRHDMQMGVNHSFLDQSTSVREAAVDLVGKFVLSRPELIDKYYERLSARILDTGVSVRKRVIKILKDICIECPEFPKIPEICVKMIRRVNDEDGIRKLVMEVFQNMWFTPTKDNYLLRKVMNITDVVASSREIGLEWFEQLLVSLFKPKEDKEDSTKMQTEPPKALLFACRQIVDCLIENVLRLDETNDTSTSSLRLLACFRTLYLFAKIRPQLLVSHASTLQPYLGLKCQSATDMEIITCVASMLELVVPLIEHPSDSFLAQLEADSIKLILNGSRHIVASCLSCLGSVINRVTQNFKLIRDIFKKFFYEELMDFRHSLEINFNKYFNDMRRRPHVRRALFTVGLLLRHFSFTDINVTGDLPHDIKDQVYRLLTYFLHTEDLDIQSYTIKALGSICIRHYEFMLNEDLKKFYHSMLKEPEAPLTMKVDVLMNIQNYLTEEDNRMIQQDLDWAKRSKKENLKEMGDVSSGMASTVIQIYLREILQSYHHPEVQVRKAALTVIQLVLQQGLVHPVQIIPYLICMSTDSETLVSHSADKQLQDIEKKYPGFIHTKASYGIGLSYQLQKILQKESSMARGFAIKVQGEYPTSLNGFLYSILRNVRQHRRALILNILKQFDEHARTTLSYMLYLSDNLAYFPYLVQDEPLFIVHHIDIMISISGTNLLQSFREGLMLTEAQRLALETGNGIEANIVSALDEDDDEDALLSRLPEDTLHLQSCITAAQGCLLLLMLKQHIKDVYGLSDGKIQQYSPSEAAKVYEKNTSRRSNAHFNPRATLQKLKQGDLPEYLDEEGRRDLIKQYLDFKQLMLQLDPDDPEDEDGKVIAALANNPNVTAISDSGGGAHTSLLTPADQVVLENYKGTSSPPKVPKLVISRKLDIDSSRQRQSRTPRALDKTKKHRHKKKRRKFVSSSGDDSENDFSDPDFLA